MEAKEPRHEKTNNLHMRKKDANQLRSYCEADQPLSFCYTDSTILLLSRSKIFQASSRRLRLTDKFVLDLFKNHIVGFLMTRLKCMSCIEAFSDTFIEASFYDKAAGEFLLYTQIR